MDERKNTDGFTKSNSLNIKINDYSDTEKPIETDDFSSIKVDNVETLATDIETPETPQQPTMPEPKIPETPKAPETVNESVDKTEFELMKHKNKSLKIWLTVLLVLLAAVIAGLAVYFMQNSKAQKDLDSAQAQNQQLQKDLNAQKATEASQQITALNKQVADLTTQNTTLTTQNTALTKQVTAQNANITQLTTVANQLKTTCGTVCNSIVIPTPPAGTTTTTSSTN